MNAHETPPAMTPQQRELTAERRSALATYREMTVGRESWIYLLGFEAATLICSGLPGIAGFGARALVYPLLFGSCGTTPAFGRGINLKGARSIHLGARVLADDYAVLDARGERGRISIGDYASIGRFTTVAAKNGTIEIGAGANIGSYCRIATQSSIKIGKSVLVAAYSYIGPGNHQRGDESTALIEREMEIRGGVEIGDHAWIGARATILDGVTIGAGAIVGAHSLVREDVPSRAVVAGTPAKLLSSNNGV